MRSNGVISMYAFTMRGAFSPGSRPCQGCGRQREYELESVTLRIVASDCYSYDAVTDDATPNRPRSRGASHDPRGDHGLGQVPAPGSAHQPGSVHHTRHER